jgi:hypothetical protein
MQVYRHPLCRLPRRPIGIRDSIVMRRRRLTAEGEASCAGRDVQGQVTERLFSRARPAYSELLHAHLQSAAFQSQEHGSSLWAANYPVGCVKSFEDVPPFYVFQSFDLAELPVDRSTCRYDGLRLRLQVTEWHVEHSPCGQNHGALDEILQFPNVSLPMVCGQNTHRESYR